MAVVEYIDNILEKYFNVLAKRGYYRYNEVYKILYIISIYETMIEMGEYIDDKIAKMLISSIECIMGTDCLFDIQPISIQRGLYNVYYGGSTSTYDINDLIRMINDVREDIPINVSQLTNDAGYLQSELI